MKKMHTERKMIRYLLIAVTFSFLLIFLFIPLISIIGQSLRKGIGVYFSAVSDPAALSAIHLTLLAVAVAVPLNLIFGLASAWSIAKFEFPGKSVLITLIDLPFSVSPVIAGLVYVLIYGRGSLLGDWLLSNNIHIIFAAPGIVLVTTFVTFPFVARELIPLMHSQGNEEEEASVLLGANGWQTFFRVTLVNIRWGLLYGVILSTARAMGEFGAVSVVSGHIRGQTNTLTTYVEMLYNEYNFTSAFAVSSLLMVIALISLIAKTIIERKIYHGK